MITINDFGDTAPDVTNHDGRVLIHGREAGPAGDSIGMRMSHAAATTLALRLLAQVAGQCGGDLPISPASALAVDQMTIAKSDPAWRLTFFVEDAPIALELSNDQFSDAAAAFASASRQADRAAVPRRDAG